MVKLSRWDRAMKSARSELGYGELQYVDDWYFLMEKVKFYFSKISKEEKDIYKRYQKTDEWKELRKYIFIKFKNKCIDCNSESQCIHHLTYDNLYSEKEKDDCVALCMICHMKRHNLKQGENENNVFVGKCYLCSTEKIIFRVDSWSGKKLPDGSYFMGSWRNFCMDCLNEMSWKPNRKFNKCVKCYEEFIGRKNEAKCKWCWGDSV